MAYDEELAHRIRTELRTTHDVTERAMFGGLAFLVAGHMAVAANSQGALMARVTRAEEAALLDEPRVRRVVMRGREMAGWLHVDPAAIETDEELAAWVARSLAVVAGLLPK